MTTQTMALPSPKAVRDQLDSLVDREVQVRPGSPVVPTVVSPAALGVYVDERLRTTAVVTASIGLAGAVGAAVGSLPAGVASEAAASGRLPAALSENFAGVLGSLAALFGRGEAPHVKLWSAHAPGEVAPSDAVALSRAVGRRLDLVVTVPGYGSGGLSVVLAP